MHDFLYQKCENFMRAKKDNTNSFDYKPKKKLNDVTIYYYKTGKGETHRLEIKERWCHYNVVALFSFVASQNKPIIRTHLPQGRYGSDYVGMVHH